MLTPNKTISLEESCLFRAVKLLSKIDGKVSIAELYSCEKKAFYDLADFIDALDLLFILGKISLDQENGIIKIA
jgi:hypothetical protein